LNLFVVIVIVLVSDDFYVIEGLMVVDVFVALFCLLGVFGRFGSLALLDVVWCLLA